jgi:hypothetical protein
MDTWSLSHAAYIVRRTICITKGICRRKVGGVESKGHYQKYVNVNLLEKQKLTPEG